MLAPKGSTFNGRPTFANPMYLKKAQSEKPCLYEISYDTSDLANRFVPDREETLTLEKESRSNLNKDLYVDSLEKEIDELESDKADFSNKYDLLLQECVSQDVIFAKLEKHSISPELALQQCQEQMKSDTVCKEKASNVFLKEREQYFEQQDLKAQLQDKSIAISELKKLIEKCKGKSMETKFDKPSVIRQPNAQRIPKPPVAFWKYTCFVRDIQGNDLLTGNRGSDLYTISLQETISSTLICFMAKASPTRAWLWHRRLYHLNFDYINLLLKKDIVIGLPKMKYVKDQLCSSCEVSKEKKSSFKIKAAPSSKGQLKLIHMDLCGPMRVESINGKKYILAEAIATAYYTQNGFIIIPTYEKTAYHIINDEKPLIRHLHIFGCTCYFTRDGENLDKMKEKGDPCILMTETFVDNNTSGFILQRQKASDYDNFCPVPQLQNDSRSADTTALSQQELDLLFGPLYDEFFTV
ncbi:retrovirus-related pol polyprotein from transposon TNT 1-94, partial [Tanacetum coccineum]